MEKQKIGVKMSLPYKEAVSYLEDLLKSLKSGTVVVESGEDHVTMKPGETVGVEVEAKVKKGKQKFSLEIEWTDTAPCDLTISDKEPAPGQPAEQPAAPAAEKPEKAKPAAPAPKAKEKKVATKKVKSKAKKTETKKPKAKPKAKKA